MAMGILRHHCGDYGMTVVVLSGLYRQLGRSWVSVEEHKSEHITKIR